MGNNPEEQQHTGPARGDQTEAYASPQSGIYGVLMKRMLVGLTVFFFIASLVQLLYLHARIADPPGADLYERLQAAIPEQPGVKSAESLPVYAALEAQALNRRYHQGNVLLMSRIWVSYLSFVTGMILCLVGASFILGRLREPTSTIGADSNLVKLSVKSSSPGIILASLGTVLIITSIMTNHRIEIQDTSIYLGTYAGAKSIDYIAPDVESEAGDVSDDFDCAVDPDGPQCQEQKKK
jgi:hypothetical protein